MRAWKRQIVAIMKKPLPNSILFGKTQQCTPAMDTLLGMYHAIRTVHGCYIAKVKNKNLSKKYIEQVPSKQKPLTRKEGLLVAL